MAGDDEDEFEFTTSDVGPREPDRFEKRGDAIEHDDPQTDRKVRDNED